MYPLIESIIQKSSLNMMKSVEIDHTYKLEVGSKCGSIALEAAISISLMLLVIFFMLMAIIASQLEAAMGASLDNTAAEISLVIPIADLIIEASEPAQEILAELKDIDHQLSDDPIISLLYDGHVTDLLSSVLLGELLERRCNFWLHDASSGQKLYLHLLCDKHIEMIWHEDENHLILEADFKIKTVFGNLERTVRSIVPLWTGKSRAVENSEDGPNVWDLDNFSRGIALREHFGAELPLNYPVIASFKDNSACAIRSMDLTAKSYQDNNRVIKVVAGEINRLADFSGYKGSAKMPRIDNDMISKRKLMLVIPSNSPDKFENQILPELIMLAESRSVDLEVIRYLDSDRKQAELVS